MLDSGRLLTADKRQKLDAELAEFSRTTGWNVRYYTTYGPGSRPDDGALRAAWQPDSKSVVVEYDATAPSLIRFVYLGDEVLLKLRRPWWFELQGRYGNMFFVREEGEQAAILQSSSALLTCLGRPEGCAVVPGVPPEQYYFTLATSVAGGLIAGFVSKLEPQGFVQRRWVWLVLFFPLWGSLFFSFGLGPIVSRTDDKTAVIANTVAFAAAAVAPYVVQRVLAAPPANDG